jgi:DNA-binding transcriptional LysR family regulator
LRVAFSTSSEPQGEFRLGVGHAVSELALSEPIDGLRQSFPQLSLSVSSDWSRQLIRNAEQNEIDAAIVVMGDHQRLPSRLTAKMIGREQLHVVGPRDWPLDEAPMEKLAETSWVLNPVGCGYRASLQSAIDDASGELNVAVETMGHELQLSLVSRRAGLGLMPERKLRQSAYRNAVKVIRVTDQSFSVGVWAIRAENIGNSASVIDHLEAALLTAWT